MRLEREGSVAGPVISGFSGGGFRVDDNVYRALLLTPERADGWRPPALAALTDADVAPILPQAPAPEFLLLGTGSTLQHPPRAFVAALEARGMGVEVMDSRAAARAWGVLRGEGRQIVAALYPFD
ncbi:MTH938/NDUFAF3 family protein [Sphingomonas donggukensis]|uniref:MTH938/NDUFAF3 family protein n=1 Tax=Sphingomonas donggukensis TaxID=2949093 RepID=A0ABY4TUR9_9SPHN|nr:Mth938-like domain-containing protein [Sphingomonas donggukensis]URW74914.1 MTH938/NDUFAF3 family protein [Sphingomonas donggukensis]